VSRERFQFERVRNATSVRITPGLELNPRALVSGRAYVGFRSFRGVSAGLRDYSGAVSTVGLTYRLRHRTGLGVTADRDVYYSYDAKTPYYVLNTYGGSVRQDVGSRWHVVASALRSRLDYRNLVRVGVAPPLAGSRDYVWNYSVVPELELGKNLRAGLTVSYATRRGTVPLLRDFDGLRVGMTASYGFQ
jgi:hypothetical protein